MEKGFYIASAIILSLAVYRFEENNKTEMMTLEDIEPNEVFLPLLLMLTVLLCAGTLHRYDCCRLKYYILQTYLELIKKKKT